MRLLHVGYIASFAAHAAIFGGLSLVKKPDPSSSNVAVMVAQKKKQKPKPPEPPKPIEAPKEILQRPLAPRKAAAPPPLAPPPDLVAAAHPALAAMPDFGISLSGGGPGAGIAVPMGGGGAAPPPPVAKKEKVLGAPAERAAVAVQGDCTEDVVKAKPQGGVHPTYTDDARAAGIEGRVRVEVTIDETGSVVSSRVVSGLGHGLDESALSAAKRMNFNPATQCGKAVRSTFVISIRFELGE